MRNRLGHLRYRMGIAMIKKLKCYFNYHKFYKIFDISDYEEKLGCRNCSKQFALNVRYKILLEWDNDLKEAFRVMHKRYE